MLFFSSTIYQSLGARGGEASPLCYRTGIKPLTGKAVDKNKTKFWFFIAFILILGKLTSHNSGYTRQGKQQYNQLRHQRRNQQFNQKQ